MIEWEIEVTNKECPYKTAMKVNDSTTWFRCNKRSIGWDIAICNSDDCPLRIKIAKVD